MKLTIIIPVFNEAKTIKEVIRRVNIAPVLNYEKEIIVVDDGSNDGTGKILENLNKEFNFIFLRHSKNFGKGSAIKTGLKKVTGDLVLIQDGDLEYDPFDWPKLLNEWGKSPKAVIYGSRNIKREKRGYLFCALGVKFLTFLTNLIFKTKLTDIYTGYKLFPSSLIKSLNLVSKGFEFEAEVTAKILKKGIPIKEVPIHYSPRKFKEGKKIRFLDGLKGIWTIVRKSTGTRYPP